MAIAKSVLQVDVDDSSFKEYLKTFNQYRDALAEHPKEWAAVEKQFKANRTSFEVLVGLELKSLAAAKLRASVEKEAERRTKTQADRWKGLARDSAAFARNIYGATQHLLRWGTITGVVGGLAGAGGLFGIDRLAQFAAAGRRTALGLGTPVGNQRAFANAFQRVVEPENVLQGVLQAKTNPADRWALNVAGVSPDQDTADAAVQITRYWASRAKSQPESSLATLLQQGAGQFFSLNDLERLRSTPGEEIEQLTQAYAKNKSDLAQSDKTGKSFQDLVTQLDLASKKIGAVLVDDLVTLAPGFAKLSAAVTETVDKFLKSDGLKHFIDEAGDELRKFADYVGSDDFQAKVKKLADGIGAVGNEIYEVAKRLGLAAPTSEEVAPFEQTYGPAPKASATRAWLRWNGPGAAASIGQGVRNWFSGGGASWQERGGANNWGNIRSLSGATEFENYATADAGVLALARQLQIDQDKHGDRTLAQLVTRWAPPGENDTARLIADAVKRTGFAADQRLDVHDPGTLSALVKAIMAQEGVRGRPSNAQVEVVIRNQTGAAVSTTVSAAAAR